MTFFKSFFQMEKCGGKKKKRYYNGHSPSLISNDTVHHTHTHPARQSSLAQYVAYLFRQDCRQSHWHPVWSQLCSAQTLVQGSNLHLQQFELDLSEAWRSVCQPLVLPKAHRWSLADPWVVCRWSEERGRNDQISVVHFYLPKKLFVSCTSSTKKLMLLCYIIAAFIKEPKLMSEAYT